MNRRFRNSAVGSVVGAALLLAACGSDSDGGAAGDDAGDGGITVLLSEWAVEAPESAPAGPVEISAVNEGGEIHELVVVRADSADDFEVDETGKVDEEQFAEGDFVGEISEFEAGTSATGTFDLDAGTYVLFCNIVEEEDSGEFESHFGNGMVTTIEVS